MTRSEYEYEDRLARGGGFIRPAEKGFYDWETSRMKPSREAFFLKLRYAADRRRKGDIRGARMSLSLARQCRAEIGR